jgi:ribosomal protein S6
MTSYQLVLLLPKQEELSNIVKMIEESKGEILKKEEIGEKPLSYKIKKYTKAFFCIFHLSFPQSKNVNDLRRILNFNKDKIIRYLLLVKEK